MVAEPHPFQSPRPLVLRPRRLGPGWLATRRVRLDPRRHPSISVPAQLSALVRAAPTGERGPREWRALPHSKQRRPGDQGPGARSAGAPDITRAGATAELAELERLSPRLDAAAGRRSGHGIRTAFLALRVASALGLRDTEHRDLLHAALLKDLRSLPEGAETTMADATDQLLGATEPSDDVLLALSALEERWDGRGPAGYRERAIPLSARILAVAEAAEVAAGEGGAKQAERTLRTSRGRALDPEVVDLLLDMGRLGLWRELDAPTLEVAAASWTVRPAPALPMA